MQLETGDRENSGVCWSRSALPHWCNPRFPWSPGAWQSHGHLWLQAPAVPESDCLSTFIMSADDLLKTGGNRKIYITATQATENAALAGPLRKPFSHFRNRGSHQFLCGSALLSTQSLSSLKNSTHIQCMGVQAVYCCLDSCWCANWMSPFTSRPLTKVFS